MGTHWHRFHKSFCCQCLCSSLLSAVSPPVRAKLYKYYDVGAKRAAMPRVRMTIDAYLGKSGLGCEAVGDRVRFDFHCFHSLSVLCVSLLRLSFLSLSTASDCVLPCYIILEEFCFRAQKSAVVMERRESAAPKPRPGKRLREVVSTPTVSKRTYAVSVSQRVFLTQELS